MYANISGRSTLSYLWTYLFHHHVPYKPVCTEVLGKSPGVCSSTASCLSVLKEKNKQRAYDFLFLLLFVLTTIEDSIDNDRSMHLESL